ncbi:MAG: YggS family pyridoxal phosphate-dependent enzyme [Deltaproteobacteria bacterium]|nr:YggS family pyridoxal phosphate-dependent enzyme [Deltaproteobacteria bacterium]
MISVRESLRIVRSRIEKACERSGRDPANIKLIGVTKGVSVEKILEALDEGLVDIGENYVQEAKKKWEFLRERNVIWHMIGHIQTNKAKYVPHIFSYVHSIDRLRILELLNVPNKPLKVLFQMNLAGEETKSGIRSEEELFDILKKAKDMKNIEPIGLMIIPPYSPEPENSRPHFRKLREILYIANERLAMNMTELSMGMSQDFEVAIEEGATMLRIGTAIFGERR